MKFRYAISIAVVLMLVLALFALAGLLVFVLLISERPWETFVSGSTITALRWLLAWVLTALVLCVTGFTIDWAQARKLATLDLGKK